MPVLNDGVKMKKMTFDGQQVKKWVHDGVKVFSAAETIIWDNYDNSDWEVFNSGSGSDDVMLADGGICYATIVANGTYGVRRAGVRTTAPIDLTEYKSISALAGGDKFPSSDGHCNVVVSIRSTLTGDNVFSKHHTLTSTTAVEQTVDLDVTEYSGEYYICIYGEVYNGSASSSSYNFRTKGPITLTVLE